MKKINEDKSITKGCILFFILGVSCIAVGIFNFILVVHIPNWSLLKIAGCFFSGAYCVAGMFWIAILVKIIKIYRKSKAISEKDNQEKIEPETDEKDKQSSEDDLHKEKSKETPKETHYAEDSLLLLTYIKDKCGCSESEIPGEDEKEQLEKKLHNAVNNVFINRLARNSICIYDPSDGIKRYPYGNWIEVEENVKLTDAINLYLELKDYVRNNKEEAHPLAVWYPYRIWGSNLTFFIVDKNIELPDIDNQFAEKLKLNNIHLVAQEGELKYVDVLDSAKYLLGYDEEPCGVDWSGTVGYYHLRKIDSETKSDKQKLSDKLLCEILLNRAEKEYTYDSVLNQINIRIPIDKNGLYFLIVRVNASTGVIKKLSFDIEEADNIHYEFDIFDAERIKKLCISRLLYSQYISEKSLDSLLTELLKQYGEQVLINLIAHKSIFTSVDVIYVEEIDNEKHYSRTYKLNEPMNTDSMIAVAKEFENESFKFSECYCDTFDENGSVLHKIYDTIEDIAKIKFEPSPYISFELNYCDRKTGKYVFSLLAYTNSNALIYIVDKKRCLREFVETVDVENEEL